MVENTFSFNKTNLAFLVIALLVGSFVGYSVAYSSYTGEATRSGILSNPFNKQNDRPAASATQLRDQQKGSTDNIGIELSQQQRQKAVAELSRLAEDFSQGKPAVLSHDMNSITGNKIKEMFEEALQKMIQELVDEGGEIIDVQSCVGRCPGFDDQCIASGCTPQADSGGSNYWWAGTCSGCTCAGASICSSVSCKCELQIETYSPLGN